MQNESSPIQVEVTTKFKRNLRILAKRYRSIRDDIQPIIEQLQSGELPGEQVSGLFRSHQTLRILSNSNTISSP